MSNTAAGMSESVSGKPNLVPVQVGAERTIGTLTSSREGRTWTVELAADEHHLTGSAMDVFEASRMLRRLAELEGIVIGFNGARPNAWASGMQRDMGSGHSVYLLNLDPPVARQRPPEVKTLGPVPLDDVGTVAEQDEFQRHWLELRGLTPPA
jgi:hypothetical protein